MCIIRVCCRRCVKKVNHMEICICLEIDFRFSMGVHVHLKKTIRKQHLNNFNCDFVVKIKPINNN